MGNAQARAEQQAEAFRQLDVDADGSVSKEEWLKVYANLDTDNDGHISRREWEKLTGNPVLFVFVKDPDASDKDNLSQDEWSAAFEQVDKNGDGQVSVQEWMMASVKASDRRELTGKDARLPLELLTNSADKQEEIFTRFVHNEEIIEIDLSAQDWIGHDRKLNALLQESIEKQLKASETILSATARSAKGCDLLISAEGRTLTVEEPTIAEESFPVHIEVVKKDGDISEEKWAQAFSFYDTNSVGSVSRKKWHTVAGNTVLFDLIKAGSARHIGNMTLDEWKQGFKKADKNQDGTINLREWLSVSLPEDDRLILMDHDDERIQSDAVLSRMAPGTWAKVGQWATSIGGAVGGIGMVAGAAIIGTAAAPVLIPIMGAAGAGCVAAGIKGTIMGITDPEKDTREFYKDLGFTAVSSGIAAPLVPALAAGAAVGMGSTAVGVFVGATTGAAVGVAGQGAQDLVDVNVGFKRAKDVTAKSYLIAAGAGAGGGALAGYSAAGKAFAQAANSTGGTAGAVGNAAAGASDDAAGAVGKAAAGATDDAAHAVGKAAAGASDDAAHAVGKAAMGSADDTAAAVGKAAAGATDDAAAAVGKAAAGATDDAAAAVGKAAAGATDDALGAVGKAAAGATDDALGAVGKAAAGATDDAAAAVGKAAAGATDDALGAVGKAAAGATDDAAHAVGKAAAGAADAKDFMDEALKESGKAMSKVTKAYVKKYAKFDDLSLKLKEYAHENLDKHIDSVVDGAVDQGMAGGLIKHFVGKEVDKYADKPVGAAVDGVMGAGAGLAGLLFHFGEAGEAGDL